MTLYLGQKVNFLGEFSVLWDGKRITESTRRSRVRRGQEERNKQEKVTTSVPKKLKMDFKIATLNLCLGLNSKKNFV